MALTLHDGYWDDVPRFGRAGHRWYRRQLLRSAIVWLRGHRLDPENEASQEILARMVRAVAEGWEPQVTWKDFDEFRGSNYASGEWGLNEKGLAELWPAAFAAATAAEQAGRYPTLDAWLAALHRGEFPELGALGLDREQMAVHLLEREPSYKRFIARRDRLHRTWPILCMKCGVEFSPGRRGIRRCPECRSARRGRSHA